MPTSKPRLYLVKDLWCVTYKSTLDEYEMHIGNVTEQEALLLQEQLNADSCCEYSSIESQRGEVW